MAENLDYKIALLVDGPNMFRAGFGEICKVAEKYGSPLLKEVYLSKGAPESLREAVLNNGYCPVMKSFKDADTALAVRATEILCSPRYDHLDLIALATRDGDFLPSIYVARDYNKRTLAICLEGNGISAALKNSADYFEVIEERGAGDQYGRAA